MSPVTRQVAVLLGVAQSCSIVFAGPIGMASPAGSATSASFSGPATSASSSSSAEPVDHASSGGSAGVASSAGAAGATGSGAPALTTGTPWAPVARAGRWGGMALWVEPRSGQRPGPSLALLRIVGRAGRVPRAWAALNGRTRAQAHRASSAPPESAASQAEEPAEEETGPEEPAEPAQTGAHRPVAPGQRAPDWQRVPIVMYHHTNYGISTPRFREQMAWLHEMGYTTLLTEDLLAFARDGRTVPERSIVLTFDDIGNNAHYKDIRDEVIPELRRYGFKAIFGIITCGVSVKGDGRHYTWSELAAWASTGDIELASHSITHPNMAKLTDEALWKELVESKAAIEKGTGQHVRVMIWPGGNRSDRTEAAARRAGYDVCMRVWDGWVKPRSDPMKLQRIRPYGTLEEFQQRVLKQGPKAPPPPGSGPGRQPHGPGGI